MGRKFAGLLILVVVFLCAWGSPARCQSPDEKKEAQALYKKLKTLYKARRYQEALPVAQRFVQMLEQSSGPDHPDTAFSLLNLAKLYRSMGAFDKAHSLICTGG